MNKTKVTYLFIVALLTSTYHQQTKTGLGTIITVGIAAGVAIFFYKQLQESQKTEVDKIVDAGADVTKKGLNAAVEKAKEIANSKK